MSGLPGDDAACFMLQKDVTNCEVVARFTISGEPKSKSRARFSTKGGKVRAYTPAETIRGEEEIAWRFKAAAPGHRPDADNEYGVFALFFNGTHQRRDVDNMLKLILDGLNKVAWGDDNQVTEVSGRKSHEPHKANARTEVLIYKVKPIPHPTITCKGCGKEVRVLPSGLGRIYCSQACQESAWKDARERVCEGCGDSFTAEKGVSEARFCSRGCSEKRGRVPAVCDRCGDPFTIQRSAAAKARFCSTECAGRPVAGKPIKVEG